MQRRPFLSLFLASPLGLITPDPLKGRRLPDSPYEDFQGLLDDVANYASRYPASEVLLADEPKRLRVGYRVLVPGLPHEDRTWYVDIPTVRRLVGAMKDPHRKWLIQSALCTKEGRIALTKSIQNRSRRLYAASQDGNVACL